MWWTEFEKRVHANGPLSNTLGFFEQRNKACALYAKEIH